MVGQIIEDTAEMPRPNPSAAVHGSGSPMIQLRRLHRFFGRTKAVNDVSFEVQAGQVFGYIGPNGAGKTTSMRILSTLELPDYGDALVDGFSCVNDPDRVRQRLGFMPDHFGTYPNMNCVEYLDFFARSYGLVGRGRTQALRHTLAYTGLDKIAEKPIRGLSKGMRQRLCLGRAMIHDPAVLVLDEPANGLDPRARIELRHMLRGLAAEGKALLVSSHILTELGEMCDAIGIIERGELIVSGSVSEIKAQLRPHIDVRLHLIDGGETLGQWLAEQPGVSHIQAQDTVVRFQLAGASPQHQAELLRAIVQAGFLLLEFSTESRSLEDVFLQITTGAVQ
ncbi:MAG: ABC transporter ATP-binding protein [Planctomycetales bacterium]|nr:ABC transporter ATP-binding protein [Planctomycetales bacterium]